MLKAVHILPWRPDIGDSCISVIRLLQGLVLAFETFSLIFKRKNVIAEYQSAPQFLYDSAISSEDGMT